MREMRAFARWIWVWLLWVSGALALAKRRLRRKGSVVVVAFHRVLDDRQFRETNSLPAILMRRRTFQELTAYIARQFEIKDLSGVACGPAAGLSLAVTFDDGWQDNYANAFPVARLFGIPITIFICPRLVAQNLPFWPEQVTHSTRRREGRTVPECELEAAIEGLKRCDPEKRAIAIAETRITPDDAIQTNGTDRTLSWNEIMEMDHYGVTFGSHTQTHQILTEVDEGTAREELVASKTEIESKLAKECRLFAYPNGDCSPVTRRLVAEAGFALAFAIGPGAWTDRADPLAVPRVNLSESAVVGPAGRFSPVLFQYTVFWKVSRGTHRAA